MFQEDITEADNQEGNLQPFLISFKDLLLEDNLDSFRADTKVEAYQHYIHQDRQLENFSQDKQFDGLQLLRLLLSLYFLF